MTKLNTVGIVGAALLASALTVNVSASEGLYLGGLTKLNQEDGHL